MLIQFETRPGDAAPDHLKPLGENERANRRKRAELRRAAWRAFVESVFAGAPRHQVTPGGGIGPAGRTAPRRP